MGKAKKPQLVDGQLVLFRGAFGENTDPPHRHRILAQADVRGAGGGGTARVKVVSNWPETRWWLTATWIDSDGKLRWRATTGAATGKAEVAAAWRKAVKAGRIRFPTDEEEAAERAAQGLSGLVSARR